MWVSKHQLKAALQKLDAVKGTELYSCPKPRLNSKGESIKPANGKNPVSTYGIHGTDYLLIDIKNHLILCGACSGELDSTVSE